MNVITTGEAGNRGKDDRFQMAYAARERRVLITCNRKHFLDERRVPPESTSGVIALDINKRSEDAMLAATAIIVEFIVPYAELYENMNMRISSSGGTFTFVDQTGARRTVPLTVDDLIDGRYPTEEQHARSG